MRRLCLLVLVAFAQVAFAQPPRPLTVDDLFRLEEIGAVALSPDGHSVALVLKRPKRQLTHFKRDYMNGHDRSDILVASTKNGRPEKVTNGATDGAGFWAPVWSRDSRRLAMLSNRGGDVRLWVWDRHTSRLRRVSAEHLENEFDSELPVWLSPTRMLAAVLPRGRSVSRLTLETRAPERAIRDWPRAWKGQLTSSRLDSGGAPSTPGQGRLVSFDVETGASRTILAGTFRQLRPSADGRFVSVMRLAEPIERDSTPLLPWHLIGDPRHFRVEVVSAGGTVASGAAAAVRDVFPGSVAWSPAGSVVAFIGYVAGDTQPSAFRFNPATGALDTLTTSGLDLPSPWRTAAAIPLRISGDGEVLLFARPAGAARSDWWRLDRSRAPANLTGALRSVPSSLLGESGDTFVGVAGGQLLRLRTSDGGAEILTASTDPAVTSVAWPARAPAGGVQHLVLRSTRNGSPGLEEFDLRSKLRRALVSPTPGAALLDFAPQRHLALFSANDRSGTRLWLSDAVSAMTLLETNLFLRGIAQGDLARIEYRSLDNQPLNGWIILPVGYREGRRYPTVVWVYPGTVYGPQQPAQTINNSHPFNLQLLAARGYAVLLPSMPTNEDIHTSEPLAELPTGVFPAIDKAIEVGIADSSRLAVFGHSYGGYAVLGLITQTNRFRAAISMAGVSNLFSYYGDFDPRTRYDADAIERMFQPAMSESGQMRMGTAPWNDPPRYIRNSPLFFADRVQTPLLIVKGDLDYVPMQQGDQFFTALYRQNKRAALQVYLGEGHVFQGPANVRDLWQRITGWLDECLRETQEGGL